MIHKSSFKSNHQLGWKTLKKKSMEEPSKKQATIDKQDSLT